MKVVFRFDAPAWECAEVRHVVGVLASLIDSAFVLQSAEAEFPAGQAVVFVGDPARAPEDCAAVLPYTTWPVWDLASLALAVLPEGVLPCPNGDSGSAANATALPAACLRSLAFLLHREEERLDPRRDQWGCYSGFSTQLAKWGVLERPIVNEWAARVAERVREWALRRQQRIEGTPRWKGGRRFAVALTHDVDWVRRFSLPQSLRLLAQSRGPKSYAFRQGLRSVSESLTHLAATNDPYCTFDRWIHEEARRGFRSTFYFCPPDPSPRHEYDPTYVDSDRVWFGGRAMTVAGLMKEIAAARCEIGLHGSYESFTSAAELSRQRVQIERATGSEVRGLRQHFLRFDSERTWEAQERAGFRYDATLGYNEAIGFRAGVAAPFHPWNPGTRQPRALLEMPLTMMDGTLFRTLALDARRAAERIRSHFDVVERVGGLAVLLWHPNATDEGAYPGWWDAYGAALEDLAARDAWVAPAGEICDWWWERSRRLNGGG